MLKTENYKNQIMELFRSGKTAKEIQQILKFKYIQPIYNILHKYDEYIKREIIYPRQHTLDVNYFNCINNEFKAYIIGFIAADGHVALDRISITLAEKDIDILYKIKYELGSNSLIKKVYRKNPYTKTDNKILCLVTISFNSVDLVKPLIKIGLLGNKTYSLDDKLIKFIPKKFIRHFLRGYFDGDGNVLYGKKYGSGTKYNINICGNKSFLESTYQIYFPSTNKMYFEKKSKQTYIWKLSSKESVTNFLKYLYEDCNIYLNRKYRVYENAHIKSDKLLENQEIDNQQPIIALNE